MTSIYDARSFYLDLTAQLLRLQSPRYPEREFWRALELADNADLARAIAALNAELDADYFDRQRSYEYTDLDFDPRYLDGRHSPENAERAAHARSFRKVLARAEGAICCP